MWVVWAAAVPATAQSAQDPAPPARVEVRGTLESNAVWNANHPANGQNQTLGFTDRADTIGLTQATLTLNADFGRLAVCDLQ